MNTRNVQLLALLPALLLLAGRGGSVVGAVGTGKAAPQEPDVPPVVLIDDFADYATDSFPERWGFMAGLSMKDAREARRKHVPALVRQEDDGNKFLEITERDDAHTIILRKKWNLRQYPCIRWRWRVVQFPDGASERIDGRKDTAVSLYVIFKIKKFLGIPKGMVGIRYLWSNVLELGDWMERRGSERLVVVQSGTAPTNEWISETINVYDNYRELYDGDDPPKEIISIGLRTDSNSTGTVAIGHYDDIEMLSECAATPSRSPASEPIR